MCTGSQLFSPLKDSLRETLLSFACTIIFPLSTGLVLSSYKHAIIFPFYLKDPFLIPLPLWLLTLFSIHPAELFERSVFIAFPKTRWAPLCVKISLILQAKLLIFPPFFLSSFILHSFLFWCLRCAHRAWCIQHVNVMLHQKVSLIQHIIYWKPNVGKYISDNHFFEFGIVHIEYWRHLLMG